MAFTFDGGMQGSTVPGQPSSTDTTDPKTPLTQTQIVEIEKPIEQRLDPESQFHATIVQRIRARLQLSYRNRSLRYDDWDRVDEHRRLYVNQNRPARKGNKQNDVTMREMPFDRAIVIPASYAIHEARKAQLFKQFMARSPLIQLDGVAMEDVKPAKLMEIKLAYDFAQSNGPLGLYALLQDTDAYGQGIVYDHWDEVYGWAQVQPPVNPMTQALAQLGVNIPPPAATSNWQPIKQFTRWVPVDPYMFWPDPRVSAINMQEGEFVGHRAFRSFLWLLERSQDNGGVYFNLDQLRRGGTRGMADSRIANRNRISTEQQFSLRDSLGVDEKDKGYVVLDHFQVKLIPKEWELGTGTQPEVWWFTMADERYIVRAHKSAYRHNEFTYGVAEAQPDPHQLTNPGIVENMDGLQRTVDWLVNSRVDNVRKFLNDMLIFSPELVEQEDIENPGPARWIRLTEQGTQAAMQGLGIDAMIKQFPVQDVTSAHFDVAQYLSDMMTRLGGASDSMQGQVTGERKTLGEINEVLSGSTDRIAMTAHLIDAMAIRPLAMRAISNAQQFYSLNQWVRLLGSDAQIDPQSLGRIQLSAQDLEGNFDYTPVSPVTAEDPARQVAVWQGVLQTASTIPQLMAPNPVDGSYLDMGELFKFIARLGGAREIDAMFKQSPQFQQAQVMPDEQVAQQVQAGNLTPAPGGGPMQFPS